MTYTKNTWVDQNVSRPKTYEVTNNQDGTITLTDSFGVVTEIGTPVNATNMNHIETGIKDNDTAIATINGKIPSNASSSNKMATASDIATIETAMTLKADKTQLHALKSYKDAGELLIDAEGLADVTTYAHSSFDSSKFTVVGSPVITSDGIASGFSNSNYITQDTIALPTPQKSIKITSSFVYSSTASLGHACTIYTVRIKNSTGDANSLSQPLFPQLSSHIDLYGGQTSPQLNIYTVTLGKIYKTVEEFTTTTRIFKIYDENDNLLYSTEPMTITGTISLANLAIYIGWAGVNSNKQTFDNGSIDLKQFSITVDGIPVFSGNVTGIDTIKPDDYTVAGSPTISADGVASGFSSANYINTGYSDFTKPFKVIVPFVFKTPSTSYNDILAIGDTNVDISQSGDRIRLTLKLQTSGLVSSNNPYFTANALQSGKSYYLVFAWDGATYTAKLYNTSDTLLVTATYTSSEQIVQTNLNLGYKYNAWAGLIDLNGVKVITNGSLVYQPCLKIPYTAGSTQYGGKYVDAVYRDRVQDAFEQGLSNEYFTLDETNGNFTLPMGNLYGMFAQRHKWVYADQTNAISTATAIGTYDLTSAITLALPNDENTYECIFRYVIARKQDGGSTNTHYDIYVNSNHVLAENLDSLTASGNVDNVNHCGQFTAIIDSTRNMSIILANIALSNSELYLVAYRKIN